MSGSDLAIAASPAVAAQAAAPGPQTCKNCGAGLGGAFCSACGQEARIETPTVREFVREFVQDQVALEGKLWRTLKVLVTRPGALTLDYISGRRQCYIRPLRLYLALSVVFFAVSGLTSHDAWLQPDAGDEDKPIFSSAPGKAPPAADPAAAPQVYNELHEVKTGHPLLDARLHKFFGQTQKQVTVALSRAIDSDAPVAMFFLLPLFAGLLQVVYLRHHLRYGVHLLFSLHYHAFVFLDLLLLQIPWPWLVNALLGIAVPAYLVLALRRVYGGRTWLTALGVVALLLVYVILIAVTLFGAAVVSVFINA